MLNYYVFEKQSPENVDIYFENEGVFNFWGEYLFVHINGHNFVLVNRTGKKFHGSITNSELAAAKSRVKNEFCGARGCEQAATRVCCEIARDWGEDICKLIVEWLGK